VITFGALKAEINDWLDENIPDSRLSDAINDGIESLWETLMRAYLNMFMAGPVNLTFTTPSQLLVTIADPTTPLVISNQVLDPSVPVHTVRAAYSYVTDSGSETKISPEASFTTAAGSVAAIHFPAQIPGVYGWNCYASNWGTGQLVLQNDEPLQWEAYFLEPMSGFTHDPNGPYPPSQNTTGDEVVYIRHMEARMPDGGLTTYEEYDIHSLLMQRMARSIATTSDYQSYAYDFINQRQVEIRPDPKQTLNTRIFYIIRPRRIQFDNATIPFYTIPHRAFLRAYSQSVLCLSIREFEAAKAWDAVAEKERTRLELAVVQMNHPKNDYVTPYL